MRAIILAGGFGTRLRSVIGDDIPKCMAPVMGRPFIKHIITNLENQGIKDITLALHYKAEKVREYLGDKYKYKIEDKPLGTGGAIKHCVTGTKPVIVINGDTIHAIDYKDMMAAHNRQVTIAVDKNNVSAGVYIVDPTLFKKFKKRCFSFEKDVLPYVTFSYYPIGWFNDIGTPEGYARVPKRWV